MIISLNKAKIRALEGVTKAHDFKTFLGFTSQYRGFEIPNLDNEVKMSVLSRLSTANWRDVPCFTAFWSWLRKKHGMHLAEQICTYMFPQDEKTRQYMVNCMRNNKSHDWWNHIKARVYKKWCSILTEMQAVYAVVSGSAQMGVSWKVMASAELDGMGIDFVILTQDKAVPVQIKKDSLNRIASSKQNNKENFSRFEITKKAHKLMTQNLSKEGLNLEIVDCLLLKYGLPENGTPAYPYLNHYENNFVYFKPQDLVAELFYHIEAKQV